MFRTTLAMLAVLWGAAAAPQEGEIPGGRYSIRARQGYRAPGS